MKTFQKSHKLDNVCYDIRGPVMDEANRMAAAGEKILKLNIGNPAPFGFRAPDEVIEAMQSNLTSTEGYSDSKGLLAARQAIAGDMLNRAHSKTLKQRSIVVESNAYTFPPSLKISVARHSCAWATTR